MSPPCGRVKAATCQTRCLKLLLHFLGFFLNLLAASLYVLACALDRVARGQRNRGKCRKAKYEFLEHGSSLNLSNWGDSIHPSRNRSKPHASTVCKRARYGSCCVLSA